MTKKILVLIFIIPFLALFSWTIWLYVQQATGKEVKVSIAGYDPVDLLSGHYIQYTIDWTKTDCNQFSDGICPKDDFCVEARWGRQCRFYIPEDNAQELEQLFRHRNNTDMVFEVVYSYHKGTEPLAKQLLINGRDWRESLKNN